MKIFVLLPRVPYPLEKGDKLRAYHLIRYLSKNNEIHLCALNHTHLHKDAADELSPLCKSIRIIRISRFQAVINIIRSLFNGKPFQLGYFYNNKAQETINELIEHVKPDRIFCQLIRVAEYVRNHPIPKTIDYQDVFSTGALRRIKTAPLYLKPVLWMEYRRLKKYERDIFEHFDQKTIISSTDRDLIDHPEKDQIHVIPNGVDTAYFQPDNKLAAYDLLFSGNMSYPPNVHSVLYLVKEILPVVKNKYPEIKLLIAGTNPHPKIRALQSEQIMVSGWVKDMRECYAAARIFIAPMLIGTGLQNKLLEAMAMQLPCITSPLANSALGAKDGEEILVAETIEQYVDQIMKLIQDKAYADKISHNGFEFVKRNFTWESAGSKLEAVLKEAL